MNLDFSQVLTISLTLFAVIDILGSVPIIIDLRKKLGHIQSEKATIVSGVIMIAFSFLLVYIGHLTVNTAIQS